jgi:hypothetical protein
MKPVGPPPAFKQELRNEKIRIGDKITLTCQGEGHVNQKVITNSAEQNHLLLKKLSAPFMEAECHHFHRNLPSDLSLNQLDPAHILTLGSWRLISTFFSVLQLGGLFFQLFSLMLCIYVPCPGYVGPARFMLLDLVIQTRLSETKNPLSVFHLQFCSHAL